MAQNTGHIFVDLGQLQDTCRAVRLDTEQGLRPGLAEADQKIHQGVPFGRHSPSGEVDAAREALVHTLRRHAENSASHLRRAEQLVAFLDRMLVEYADADRLSAVDLNAVLQKLDEALPQPSKPQPAHGVQP